MIWWLSDKVKRVLKAERISQEELAHMLRHAAKCRLPNAQSYNRRYHQWVFAIDGCAVKDMRYAERLVVGSGHARVFEEHEACNGAGCHGCGWIGSICRLVQDDVRRVLEEAKVGRIS